MSQGSRDERLPTKKVIQKKTNSVLNFVSLQKHQPKKDMSSKLPSCFCVPSESKQLVDLDGFGRWNYKQQTNIDFYNLMMVDLFQSAIFHFNKKSTTTKIFPKVDVFSKHPSNKPSKKQIIPFSTAQFCPAGSSEFFLRFLLIPQPPVEILCASSASALNVVSPSVWFHRWADSGRILLGKKHMDHQIDLNV